jgi:hypothetical protein
MMKQRVLSGPIAARRDGKTLVNPFVHFGCYASERIPSGLCTRTIDLDAYALTPEWEIWLDTHSFLTDCIRWVGNFVFG